jgi:hypothetical protein
LFVTCFPFINAAKSTEAFQEGKQSWVGNAAIKESDMVTRNHAGFDHGWSQEVRTSNHKKLLGGRRSHKASRARKTCYCDTAYEINTVSQQSPPLHSQVLIILIQCVATTPMPMISAGSDNALPFYGSMRLRKAMRR